MCKVATQQAIADSLAQVAETDETNNTRSYTETICLTIFGMQLESASPVIQLGRTVAEVTWRFRAQK